MDFVSLSNVDLLHLFTVNLFVGPLVVGLFVEDVVDRPIVDLVALFTMNFVIYPSSVKYVSQLALGQPVVSQGLCFVSLMVLISIGCL